MPLQGDYEPSPAEWVRNQVAEYESSGGQRANTLLDTGLPVIIVTTKGNKSGKIRKMPLMRVEHDGEYALVASKGEERRPIRSGIADLVAYRRRRAQDGAEPFHVDVRPGRRSREGREWWTRRWRRTRLRRISGEDRRQTRSSWPR